MGTEEKTLFRALKYIYIFSQKFKEILEENYLETLLSLKALAILSFQLF